MKKRSLLRRSGVSFRSAAEECRIEKEIETNTPSKPTKHKRQAEKDQLEIEKARKTKKNRMVEYSEDEDMERAQKTRKNRIVEYSKDKSDEDEDSEWAVVGRAGASEKTAILPAASGENEPSGTDREQTPKTVGKRKLGEEETRRLTRQRKGVDKMGGVMIHRIEHK